MFELDETWSRVEAILINEASWHFKAFSEKETLYVVFQEGLEKKVKSGWLDPEETWTDQSLLSFAYCLATAEKAPCESIDILCEL